MRLKMVLIPQRNRKDLVDIPRKIRRDLNIVPVEHMEEILSHALLPVESLRAESFRDEVLASRPKRGRAQKQAEDTAAAPVEG
jgi:predicted ATP-dependent protease